RPGARRACQLSRRALWRAAELARVPADTADQTDVRVGALPAEPAVEAGDARGRLVAPAGVLELLRGKIERPSSIRHALAVALQDDRDRALRRRERNVLFDQLPHASIARRI